jgi:hypothetical protein
VDPLADKYPHNGPYNFSENRVIDGVELEGLEFMSINIEGRVAAGGASFSAGYGLAAGLDEGIVFFSQSGAGFSGGLGAHVNIMFGFHFSESIYDIEGGSLTGGFFGGVKFGGAAGGAINFSDDLNHGYLSIEGGVGANYLGAIYVEYNETEITHSLSWDEVEELAKKLGHDFDNYIILASVNKAIAKVENQSTSLRKELKNAWNNYESITQKLGDNEVVYDFDNGEFINKSDANNAFSEYLDIQKKLENVGQALDLLFGIQTKVESNIESPSEESNTESNGG